MTEKELEDFTSKIEEIFRRLKVIGVSRETSIDIMDQLGNPDVLKEGGMLKMLKECLTAEQFLKLDLYLN